MSMTEARIDEELRRKRARAEEAEQFKADAQPKLNVFLEKFGEPEELKTPSFTQAFAGGVEDAKIRAKQALGIDPYRGAPEDVQAYVDRQQAPAKGFLNSSAELAGKAVGNVENFFSPPSNPDQAPATEAPRKPIEPPPPQPQTLQGAPDIQAPASQGTVEQKVASENAQMGIFDVLSGKVSSFNNAGDLGQVIGGRTAEQKAADAKVVDARAQDRALTNTEFQRRFGRPKGVYDSAFGANAGMLTPEQSQAAQVEKTKAAVQQRAAELNPDDPFLVGIETTMRPSYMKSEGQQQLQDAQNKPTETGTRNFTERTLSAFTTGGIQTVRAIPELYDATRWFATGDANFKRSDLAIQLQRLQQEVEAALPGDSGRNREFLSKFGGGVGSFSSMLVGGAVLRGLGVGVRIGASAVGAAQGGVQLEDEAASYGASNTKKYLSLFVGGALGATEGIPIGNALDRAFGIANQASGGAVMRILASGTVNSLEEMTQEVGQQIGQNTWAKLIYDNRREIFSGVTDAGQIAGIIGFLFGGGTQALNEGIQAYQDDGIPLNQAELDRYVLDGLNRQRLNNIGLTFEDGAAPRSVRDLLNGGPVNTPAAAAAPSAPQDSETAAPVSGGVEQPNQAPADSATPVAAASEFNAPPAAAEATTSVGRPAAPPAPVEATPQAIAQEQAAPPEQAREFTPQVEIPASPGKSAGLFVFDVTQLNTDAERFQYKSGGDEEGVTGRLKGVKKWDPAKANQLMVWQGNDGKLYVVDGHQRSGLARRLIAEGNETQIKIPGLLFRESDGFTPERMRALAAGKNIAEGSGTILDAAKVLKVDPSLIDESMPVSDYKIRQATDLSRLGDDAFRMVINEVTDPTYGAIVGRLIPEDPALQVAAISALNKIGPANETEAELVVRRVKNSQLAIAANQSQGGLFGDQLDMPESTVMEEIRIVARAMAELKKDKAIFARVVKNADTIESVGSKINREASSGIVTESDRAMILLETQTDTAGPIRTQLLDLARQVKEGKTTAATAARQLAEAIRKQPAFRVKGEAGNDLPKIAAMKPAAGQGDLFGAFNQGAEIARQEAAGRNAKRAQQLELPGTERSAVQLAASRDAAGRGMLRGSKPQSEADQGLFSDQTAEPRLLPMAPSIVMPSKGAPVIVENIGTVAFDALKRRLKEGQPFDTLDQLMELAAVVHDELARVSGSIAISSDAYYRRAPLKKRERIEEKMAEKPSDLGPRNVTDVARGGFDVASIEQADAVLNALAQRFALVDEGWILTETGYFDRKVMVVFDNGMVGEIQMWAPGMFNAKEIDGGHDLYKAWRSETDAATREALRVQQIAFYKPYLEKLGPDFQDLVARSFSALATSTQGNLAANVSAESSGASRSAVANSPAGLINAKPPSSPGFATTPTASAPAPLSTTGSESQAKNLSAVIDTSLNSESTPTESGVNTDPTRLGASPAQAFNPGVARTPSFPGEQLRPDQGIPMAPGAEDQDAVRLGQVVDRIIKALNLTYRQGNVGIRGALGSYNTRTGVIRTKVREAVIVLSHEAGHALHLQPQLRPQIDSILRAHQAEVTALAQGVSSTPSTLPLEGFAEFTRLYLTNRAYLQQHAPGLLADFDTWLRSNNPALHGDLAEVHNSYQAFLTQPTSVAIPGNVVTSRRSGPVRKIFNQLSENGLGGTLVGLLDRTYDRYVDDANPVYRAMIELRQIAWERNGKVFDLLPSEDAYKLLRLARNARTRAMLDIQGGTIHRGQTTPTGPSLVEAIQLAVGKNWTGTWNEDDIVGFGAYLYSRRIIQEWLRFQAGELANEPDTFSLGEHSRFVQEYEQKNLNVRQAADLVYAFQREQLRKAYENHLISKETYTELSKRADYVPANRDMSDKRADGETTGGNRPAAGRSIMQRFRGSQRAVINPLESIMQRAFVMADVIAKNEPVLALAKFAEKAGTGSGAVVEPVAQAKLKSIRVSVGEAIESIAKEQGLDPADVKMMVQNVEDFLGDDIAHLYRGTKMGNAEAQAQNIIFYWENGQRKALQVNDVKGGKDLYEALSGMSRSENDLTQNLIFQAVRIPGIALQMGITKSLDFILSNFLIDQSMQFMLEGKVPIVSGLRGLASEAVGGESSRLRNLGGAVSGGAITNAIEDAAIERNIKALQRRGYNIARFTGQGGLKELIKLTEITETGSRADLFRTAYKRARAQGLSEYEAVLEASYVSNDILDFSRRGSRMLAAARAVPFLNVSIQGLDKSTRAALVPLFRQMRNLPLNAQERQELTKAKWIWARVAAGMAFSIGLASLYWDDPEYQDIPDTIKATHFLWKSGDVWYRLKKPMEFAIFFNLAQYGFEGMANKDPTWASRWAQSSFDIVSIPTQIPLFKTINEVRFNRDSYTGQPIVSDRLIGLEPWKQYNYSTSELSKSLGKIINVSPAVIDHIINGWSGSLGRNILALVDRGIYGKELDPSTAPFIRRFTWGALKGNRSTAEFYDLVSRTTGRLAIRSQTYNSLLRDRPTDDDAKAYIADGPDDERVYMTLNESRGDGDPTFPASVRRMHPLLRAKDAVAANRSVIDDVRNGVMKDRNGNVLARTPSQQKAVTDILLRASQIEMHNSLVLTGVPGWANRSVVEVSPVYEELKAADADAYAQLMSQRKDMNIYSFQGVQQAWPTLKERILTAGSSARLGDLLSQVKRIKGY